MCHFVRFEAYVLNLIHKYVKNMKNELLKKCRFTTMHDQVNNLKVQNFSKSSYDMHKVVGHLFQHRK